MNERHAATGAGAGVRTCEVYLAIAAFFLRIISTYSCIVEVEHNLGSHRTARICSLEQVLK